MKKIVFILFGILILNIYPANAQQRVTLSTYYPAPFGAYDRLRLVPRADMEDDPCALGLMYFETGINEFVFCGDYDNDGDGEFGFGVPWIQTGDTLFTTDLANNNLGVAIGENSPDAYLEVSASGTAGTTLLMLSSDDNNDGDRLIVTTAGNMGVNDTTPDALLEVSASGGGADLLMLSSNDGSDGDRLIVENNGDVGIGITNPPDDLTVSGGGGDILQRISIENGGAGNAWLRLTETNFRGGFLRYDNATNDFHIGVHNNDNRTVGQDTVAMTIDRGTGNVGVGPTGTLPGAPQRLNVDGNINLRANGANWGPLDVVFSGGVYRCRAVYGP